jgi:simple sugar transport system permease protein
MSGIIVGILSSTISLAVILLIAAEGEIFVERSGQFNMGIEGIMISSALTSFVGTYFTKYQWNLSCSSI